MTTHCGLLDVNQTNTPHSAQYPLPWSACALRYHPSRNAGAENDSHLTRFDIHVNHY